MEPIKAPERAVDTG